MRRLVRRLFTLCPAVSLVLCVAVCVLWVRSYRFNELVIQSVGHHAFSAYSDRGELRLRRQPWGGTSAYRRFLKRDATPGNRLMPPYAKTRWPGGFWFESESQPSRSHVVLVVPHWAVATALFVLPGSVVVRRTRAFLRRSRKRCPACGYDLRATPGRCPECWAAAANADRTTGPYR